MLYYVRTGEIDTSIVADTPRQAAVGSIRASRGIPGVCVLVSEESIDGCRSDSHMFFHTDSIMEECMELRIVR